MTHRSMFCLFLLLAATVPSTPYLSQAGAVGGPSAWPGTDGPASRNGFEPSLATALTAGPLLMAENDREGRSDQGPAAPPDAAEPPASPVEQDTDLNSLHQQIQSLQKKVDELEKESEARKILRVSEEEKAAEETEVLSAAGREYTLIPKDKLGFEYGLQYEYFSSDLLEDLRNSEGNRLAVERRGNHTLVNSLFLEKGILNNLSINATLPFVYKYDNRTLEKDREVTDLGDISAGLQYQPFKTSGAWPAMIIVLDGAFPTGRSPYKINPDTDLSTGNGFYSATAGVTLSKTLDPVVAFGNLYYTHAFDTTDTDQIQAGGLVLTEVDPGESFGFAVGTGFALSYKTSLNFSYQYAYHRETRYFFADGSAYDSNSWVTSSINIGSGWRLSPKYSLIVRVGIGLTRDDPDFTFSIRIPVRFDLGD